jgi:Transposase DDE domain
VSIPYWGDGAHLENNWSGTRHKAIPRILAALAQDPHSGIVTYGDTNVRHKNKAGVVVAFLDFYNEETSTALKSLVFDSKFTTYENLRKLEDDEVKFVTIRRRGEKILSQLTALPSSEWTAIRVPDATGKGRTLSTNDQTIPLAEYGKPIRQIAIIGQGKIKPALLLTNDFTIKVSDVVRKYAQRWLVEQDSAEQIYFFHLNRGSSSMVIKVDFDFTMSILAHNLYRLLAADLPGYSHATAQSLFNRFILNSGHVRIDQSAVTVLLRKKRHLPALLTAMRKFPDVKISFLNRKILCFAGASHS